MRRFIVFAGTFYYPGGGFEDYQTDVDEFEPARQFALGYLKANGNTWAHVFDLEQRKIVWKGHNNYGDEIKETHL
jgi:hypothetical protein